MAQVAHWRTLQQCATRIFAVSFVSYIHGLNILIRGIYDWHPLFRGKVNKMVKN